MMRWLNAGDLAQWRDIRSEGLRTSPTAFLTTLAEFEAESDASVAEKLAQGKVLGAFRGDSLQAVAAYLRKSSHIQTQHRAEIAAVYVRAEARGTGMAVRLMEQIEREARAEGVTQLELYVEGSNDAAVLFYEKRGFKRFGIFPNASVLNGFVHDDFFMVRLLDR